MLASRAANIKDTVVRVEIIIIIMMNDEMRKEKKKAVEAPLMDATECLVPSS